MQGDEVEQGEGIVERGALALAQVGGGFGGGGDCVGGDGMD